MAATPQDPAASSAAAGDGADNAGQSPAGGDGEGPPRRKRRRRRRGKRGGPKPEGAATASGSAGTAAQTNGGGGPAKAKSGGGDGAWQTLAAGLFSHLDDRPIPCSVDGCTKTWFWSVQEQMQAFGKPPPRRMCADHEAARGNVSDKQVSCANPGCGRTWTWSRGAQLKAMQRSSGAQAPSKVCAECLAEEKQLADREVNCRVEGCKRTWTWSADAQLKHRVWARRYAEEQRDGGGSGGGGRRDRRGKKGRRRKPRPDIHEPPGRMCNPCHDKLAKIEPREGPCKVHGCTRMAVIDRDAQLRAWARLGTEDLQAHGSAGRRMCITCRDFCRSHPDRQVRCGRPGCEQTWTYKTGAQLQDFLAGRSQEPVRLCDECGKGGGFSLESAPDGMEVMPCVVTLCDGVWFFREGTTAVVQTGEALPVDRMCDRCRKERGAEPRNEPVAEAASPPVEDGASEPADAAAGADAPADVSAQAEATPSAEVDADAEATPSAEVDADAEATPSAVAEADAPAVAEEPSADGEAEASSDADETPPSA